MGQSISVHLTRADEQGHQQGTIEQMRLIQQVLIENCKAQAKKMKELALNDQRFPIVAVVGQTEKFFVQAENVASEEIERHVSGVIHSAFIGGFLNIMSAVVNELLEDTSATEQERSGSHVVFANSSFLRVNYYLYKYEFGCKDLKAMFKNAVCCVMQVGLLDIENTSSSLLINELNSTIGTNVVSLQLSKRIFQRASFMSFLYKRITYLQSVFGAQKKSMLAFKNILRYLLNIYQIAVPTTCARRSVPSGLVRGATSGTKKPRRPRDPSPYIPLTTLHPNPNLSAAPQLTERLEPAVVPSFSTLQERKRRKRKEKLKRQKERDNKADWEGAN